MTNNNAGDAFALSHHIKEARRLGVWPSYTNPGTNIPESLERLQNYKTCMETDCTCRIHDLKGRIHTLILTMLSKVHGLCLHCVKEGRVTEAEGNCLARRNGPWCVVLRKVYPMMISLSYLKNESKMLD